MIKCRLYIRRLVQNSITPLHVAAKWGRKGMVALLLDSGATIDARTRVIESALVIHNTFSFCRFCLRRLTLSAKTLCFQLSMCYVRSSVRTDIVTTISYEQLEQF